MEEWAYQGENELVQALKKGDAHAHYWLVKIYGGRMKAWIRYLSRRDVSDADVEELTYKVFDKVIRGVPSFEPVKSGFKTWVYRIVHNALRDYEREQFKTRQGAFEAGFEYIEVLRARTKRDPDFVDPGVESEPDPDDPPESSNIELVRQALENLSEKQRTVLIEWAYLQSHTKVAGLLKKKEGTIRVEFHRAKRALREEYERLKAHSETS